MVDFDLKEYVMKEFENVWKAIDGLRTTTGGLGEKVAVMLIKIETIEKGVTNIQAAVDKLNVAREELDKQPLRAKAKFVDVTIIEILKAAIPWVIAAIAIVYKMKG